MTYRPRNHRHRMILWACEHSFNFFAAYIGYIQANFHKEWTKMFFENKSTVIAAPRNHAKSYWVILMMLWIMIFPNKWRKRFKLDHQFLKLAYITSTDKILRKQSKDLMNELNNTLEILGIKEQIDVVIGNTETVQLSNGSVLEMMAIFGAIRGVRAHIGFSDDLMKDKGQKIEEVISVYEGSVIPIYFPNSKRVLLGTVKADNDIINQNLRNEYLAGKLYKAINIDVNGNEYVLWPEFWTLEALHDLKMEISTVTFAREYQNEPSSSEFAVMPLDLLQLGHDDEMFLGQLEKDGGAVYFGVDLARGDTKDADYTVIVAFQILPEYKERKLPVLKILDIWSFHASTIPLGVHPVTGLPWKEPFYRFIVRKLKEWTVEYDPQKVFIENNQFQETIVQMVGDPDLVGTTIIPAEGVYTGAKKHDEQKGIPIIQTLLQSKRIIFPYGNEYAISAMGSLEDELQRWIRDPITGKYVCTASHDDKTMAIYTGVTGILERIDKHTGVSSVPNPHRKPKNTTEERKKEIEESEGFDKTKNIAIIHAIPKKQVGRRRRGFKTF